VIALRRPTRFSQRSTPARPGITLIEVLVALAIFLLALGAIARLIDVGSDNATDAVNQSDAVRLAQSKLAEVEAGVIPADSGSNGTFDTEPGWTWQVVADQTGIPNLFSVSVTVTRDSGRQSTVVLTQMVMDPKVMGKPGEIPKPTTSSSGTTTGTTGASP
jgi:general secretion pathway protein I